MNDAIGCIWLFYFQVQLKSEHLKENEKSFHFTRILM